MAHINRAARPTKQTAAYRTAYARHLERQRNARPVTRALAWVSGLAVLFVACMELYRMVS